MTCVVAVEDPSGIAWIGSDSFLGSESYRERTDRPKWFRYGPYLVIGYAGVIRPAQVIEFGPPPRAQKGHESDRQYLITVVATAIRKAHLEAGIGKKDLDFAYVATYGGRVYTIQADYSVVRSVFGYTAIGEGEQLALGSFASTEDKGAEERAHLALKAAARHSNGVTPKFFVEAAPTRPRGGSPGDRPATGSRSTKASPRS